MNANERKYKIHYSSAKNAKGAKQIIFVGYPDVPAEMLPHRLDCEKAISRNSRVSMCPAFIFATFAFFADFSFRCLVKRPVCCGMLPQLRREDDHKKIFAFICVHLRTIVFIPSSPLVPRLSPL